MAMGQMVRLATEGAPLGRARGAVPKTGDFVRVSGLRDAAGSVLATRVERLKPRPQVSVTAALDHQSGKVARIGALNAVGVKTLPPGQVVRLAGVLKNGVLAVRETHLDPALDFQAKPERLVLQGVAQAETGSRLLDIG